MLSLLASNISTKNINTQKKHTTSAQRNKSQVQSMDSEAKDFTYTTDQQNWLLHKRKIDAGGYGDVHEMYNIQSGKCFARKLLHLRNPRNRQSYLENEARAVRKLCNGEDPNVIQVFKVGEFIYSSYFFIDMELCDLSLQGYLYPDTLEYAGLGLPPLFKHLPSSAVADYIWNIMRQIASGLKFVHTKCIAHRDVKPSNVLYSRTSSLWKLTDFGLASETADNQLNSTTSARGTDGYRAPELANNEYGIKVDIWSMGCLLHELATRKRAFFNDLSVIEYCSRNGPLSVCFDITLDETEKASISEAISKMLQPDPSARPSAAMLYDEFVGFCNCNCQQSGSDGLKTVDTTLDQERPSTAFAIAAPSPTLSLGQHIPERRNQHLGREPTVEVVMSNQGLSPIASVNPHYSLIDMDAPDYRSDLLFLHPEPLSPSSALTSPFTDLDIARSPASTNSPSTPFEPRMSLYQPTTSTPVIPEFVLPDFPQSPPPDNVRYSSPHFGLQMESKHYSSIPMQLPALQRQEVPNSDRRPRLVIDPAYDNRSQSKEQYFDSEEPRSPLPRSATSLDSPRPPPQIGQRGYHADPPYISPARNVKPPISPLKRFKNVFKRNHSRRTATYTSGEEMPGSPGPLTDNIYPARSANCNDIAPRPSVEIGGRTQSYC